MRFLLGFLFFVAALGNHNGGDWPASPTHIEWHRLNGKTADPCASYEQLDGTNRKDCIGIEWPEPAVTVLIPSITSTTPTFPAGAVTLVGKNMIGTGAVTTTTTLALSKEHRGCDDIDTGIVEATATCLLTGTNAAPFCEGLTFTIPDAWRADTLEVEESTRKLCWSSSGATAALGTDFRYTGLRIGVVWDCDDTAVNAAGANTKTCNLLPGTPTLAAGTPYTLLTNFEKTVRAARTTCCRHTTYAGTTLEVPFPTGQCINPSVKQCCQGAAIEPSIMRCCSTAYETVQWYTRPCPCQGTAPACPSGETCCGFTKYPELNSVTALWPEMPGQCFNATTHKCCDTGVRYDPGEQQCCNITGVQSLNVPCPCNDDADCQGGQSTGALDYGLDEQMICCRQDQPDIFEVGDRYVAKADTGRAYPRCSKYSNFPTGTSPYHAQRCLGTCMDNRFQICCNGVLCHREFDRCCNSTCCNKFTGSCTGGMRPGTPNNKWNYMELGVRYEQCSTVEALNPIKAFWIYVLPAYLLLATVIALAFVIAFINKSSRRSFSFLERAMITIAFLTIILAVTAYFAPVYKYGVWVVFVSLLTILAAAARLKWLNAALVVIQFFTLLFLLDPFHGNNYLNFSSLRVVNGDPDPQSAGILHSVHKMWKSLSDVNAQQYCTKFLVALAQTPNC
eukprot:TRINITY_DN9753_c0_g1_i2.p1 TRINITY_DN9753_c0_g1~~TRINITY_DN9753_c0_g1_i2.p1  ORF type:complete len:676 (-),score=152.91 TRINITY_DN9753_c0_g1_i2:39-2066(-)